MPGQLGTLRSACTAARWWGGYVERSVPRERVKFVVPLFEMLFTVGIELKLEQYESIGSPFVLLETTPFVLPTLLRGIAVASGVVEPEKAFPANVCMWVERNKVLLSINNAQATEMQLIR